MKLENRLILALDVVGSNQALTLAHTLAPYIDAIKVGYPLILAQGLAFISKLTTITNIICDIKLADIPNTNKLIVRQFKNLKVSGIIVHGFVGSDAVKAAIDEFSPNDTYVVVEMSHHGALEYMQPYGEKLALMAKNIGAAGIIAPATRPERIRVYRNIVNTLKILVPGVGVQGGNAKQAIENGADYVIVGRSIYTAKNPVNVAKMMVKELKSM